VKQVSICVFISLILLNRQSLLYSQTSMAETAFDYGKRLYGEQFYDLAVLQFQDFLEQYPAGPDAGEAWYYLGASQFHLKEYENAQKAFLNLVVLFPNYQKCPEAYLKIAECFQGMKKNDAAVTSFQRVYEFYPEHEMGQEGLYRAAKLLLNLNQIQQASGIAQRLQNQQLKYELRSRLQFLLANIYVEKDRSEDALNILRSIYNKGIRKEDRPIAGLQMASIYSRMGLFDQSLALYRELTNMSQYDSVKQAALYQSGLIAYRLQKLQTAEEQFHNLAEINPSFNQMASVYYYLGMIAVHASRFSDAVDYLYKAIETSNSLKAQQDYRMEIAKIAIQNNDYDMADSSLQWILKHRENDSKYCQAYLFMAKSLYQQKEYEKAFYYYQRVIQTDPDDPIIPYILMKKSNNYLERGIIQQAWSILREIWERYPDSELAPKAHFLYAESLAEEGDWSEASREYQFIIEKYSGSDDADSASLRMNHAEGRSVILDPQEIVYYHSLTLKVIKQPDDFESCLQYAVFLIDRIHLYSQALPYLRRCMAFQSQKAKVQYYSGLAYFKLYQMHRQRADKDSASRYFTNIIKSQTASLYAVNAAEKYSSLMQEPESKLIQRYKLLLPNVTDSIKRCQLVRKMGHYYFKKDSLEQAQHYFQLWVSEYSDLNPELAHYYLACIQQRMGNEREADSMFNMLEQNYPKHSKMPYLLYYRGRFALRHQKLSDAIALYQRVQNDYPYTNIADSADYYLGEIFIDKKQYKKAVRLYSKIIQKDSLKSLAYEAGLIDALPTMHPNALIGLAKAYEGLGQYAKAESIYFKYHDLYTSGRVVTFYANLARIAEKQNQYERAIQYIQQILNKEYSDGFYERLGILYEKSGDYDQAYTAYQKALACIRKTGREAILNQKLILCLLRQNKLPEADVRINVFKKSFKKQDDFDSLMAEVYLEKGKSQFRQKNFKEAEALFDDVRDKFKKTPFRIQAELELGRTLIVTNKIDDALDLLTRMVEKYKDDPVYFQVYLNLGDLYFKNRQYENALKAFKIVQKDSIHSDNQQLADRYLIRVYETMGFWEAALALARHYIAEYPNAEDRIQKKVQIGNLYMRLKDYNRAIDQFQKVQIEADSETEAEIQYWIGKCYAEMGQLDRAILEYLKVKYVSKPTKLPWGSTALYEAAMAYLKLYQPWKARVIFEKIVRYEGATSDLGRIARQRIDDIDQGKFAKGN